jgi:hypothetical protein
MPTGPTGSGICRRATQEQTSCPPPSVRTNSQYRLKNGRPAPAPEYAVERLKSRRPALRRAWRRIHSTDSRTALATGTRDARVTLRGDGWEVARPRAPGRR